MSTSEDVAPGNFEGHSVSLGRQFHEISESLQWNGVASLDDDRSRGLQIPD